MSILPSRPIIPHTQSTCPSCSTPFEYPTPYNAFGSTLQIRCFQCNNVVSTTHGASSSTPPPNPTSNSNNTNNAGGGRKRKIGTQERPLETAYYDILEIPINASEEEIKKAYRRLAIKYHPDKNRDDPNAEEKFKSLSIAYQTLSSPPLRRKYNEFGSSSSSSPDSSSYIDPEEVFGAIFGGERFVGIIGEIGLARDMKSALQEGEEDEQVKDDGGGRARDKKGRIILTPEEKAKKDAKERQAAEEKAKIREERVRKLIVELERKLSIYTESATGDPVLDKELGESWRQICLLEAEDLKNESYGLELLHTIGFVYDSKARHWMESQRYFGVGGWVHNVQGKYHVFSETVSTLRSAMDLKAVFDQIAAAEKNGTLSDSERKKLEEQAAEKGLLALFKGAKLEIESVLRETCDRVLSPTPIPPSPPPTSTSSTSSNPNSSLSTSNSTSSSSNPNNSNNNNNNPPPIPFAKLKLRAQALQILGEAYMSVKKDGEGATGEGGGGGVESEYVRVDTRGSRERDERRAQSGGGR